MTRDGAVISADELKPSDLARYSMRRTFLLDYLYYSKGRAIPFRTSPSIVNRVMEWCDVNVDISKKLDAVQAFKDKSYFLEGKIKISINTNSEEANMLIFFLYVCQYIGIGKKTTYGMGQYQLVYTS